MKYNRLEIIEGSNFIKKIGIKKLKSATYIKAICDCGVIKEYHLSGLKRGHTKSCGCLKIEKSQTHGHHKKYKASPTYVSWCAMRSRCTNFKHISYNIYSKLGYVKRWNKFENFLADMGERLSGTSLDRVNNNKGYSKINCRWATQSQQCNNKKNNRLISYNQKNYSVTELSRLLSMHPATLFSRLWRGWTIEECINKTVVLATGKHGSRRK